jgi:replicative superfamily II helicase
MGYKISLVFGVLLAASLTGNWILVKQIATLKSNQLILESKISEQNESIKQYLAKQEQLSASLGVLETDKQNALREVTKLRNTFAKHDLDNLALNKPKLVEKIVNRGTKRVIDNLVTLTTVTNEEPDG